MGDFNAKIGEGNESCLGKFTHGTRNERGEDLINFSLTNNLKIVNTLFKKKANQRWTWRSPNHETHNEIDYILTNKHDIMQDIQVMRKINVGSDHRMVRCRVKVNFQEERRKLFRTRIQPLRIAPNLKEQFKIQLKNAFEVLEEENISINNNKSESVQNLNNNIVKQLIEIAELNGEPKQQTTSKYSPETRKLMEKRRNLKKPTSAKEKIEKAELDKLISKKQRQDIRSHNTKIVESTISQGRGFKLAKKKLNQGRIQMCGIKGKDGTIIKCRERIMERTKEFYQELYASKNHTCAHPSYKKDDVQKPFIPPVTTSEIHQAINQLKRNKAPGEDNITPDLIKDAAEIITPRLANLFTECLKQGKIPTDWQNAIIILLHKKGDQKELGNYRPISLLPIIYKLFTKVITNRIAKELDNQQPREQAGFRKGFSTIDHLHTINQLIEKSCEYNIPLCLAFIDYQKAFDSVEITAVISALEKQGIELTYVNMIKNIYENCTSVIRLHKDSEPFQLQKGVRQGDTISPKLFTACLEEVFKQLDWEEKGLRIDGEYLSHLRFADDIVLITEDPRNLQKMLEELNIKSKDIGLKMNLKKTQVMINNLADPGEDITLEGTPLEKVEKYIYLGQIISMNSNKENEIKRRISLGWQAFGRASSIFKSKIPISLKNKVYNQCILPTITYGAETWNLTKKQMLKLRSAQRAHERIMLNVTWKDHKTATWLREQTKLRDIVETVKQLKWNWAGHLARIEDTRWTIKVTKWTPLENKRNRGKQKIRWRDEIQKFIGNANWYQQAQTRNSWKSKGKAFVQEWTTILG